ncbi:serum amyloid A-3 protein [Lingula anatina]|uniref:Serum amyloid A-3 protein n=1 Tax=Lingula anatina TaxID=7574 RepID=A0A1S3JQX3_LINAN|nr:serum amyloid A-3 protein [Lingula anatina]|eukprot:XP_013412765.1 serum amyloid A-3 protein [Lingula anatina]
MKKTTVFVFGIFLAVLFHLSTAVDSDVAASRVKRGLPRWINRAIQAVPAYCAATAGAAAGRMRRAYYDMRRANWQNCDKYFHCRGNYEAGRLGYCGKLTAKAISEAREWAQSGGSHGSDSAEDRVANDYGRAGGNCVQRYILGTRNTRQECSLPRRLW